MKKALSFILALTLAFSLLPTFAMAADSETAETESAVPTTFSVDFTAYTTPDKDSITSDKTIGPGKSIENFAGENWNALLNQNDSTIYAATTGTGVSYKSTYLFFDVYNTAEKGFNVNDGNNTFSLTFDVAASGVYDISSHVYNGKQGGYTEMFIDGVSVGKVENCNQGGINGEATNGEGNAKQQRDFNKGVALSADTHTMKLVFTPHEKANTANRANCMFYDITFTPSTVTEVDESSVKLSKPSYEIGETFLPSVSFTANGQTIVDPDGSSVVAVELTSNNDSVVKCSDSAFIALTAGTAKLTAKISVNGKATGVVDLGEVTVSPATEAKAFTLDFSAPISSIDLLYTNEGNYYITSTSKMFGTNWEAVTNKNVSTLLKSTNRIRYFKDSRIQVYAYAGDLTSEGEDDPLRDTMAFDFYVPADGVYDLSAVVYKAAASGYASLYIDDTLVGKHDLYNDTTLRDVLIDDYDKVSLAAGKHRLKIVCAASSVTTSANAFCNITFTPSPEDEALTNAFEVTKEALTEYVAPSVVSVSAGGSVITPEKNSDGSYDIEAAEETTDGAKFLYWAKGLKANKKIVSFSNKLENYIPEEKGADWLIAVYDDMLPSANEYYNANGQLLATGEEPTLPSMAGYGKADAWKQYGETNIYVAEYAGKTQPDNVEVTVNGEKKTVPYGTEITCTSTAENFKCWTKSNINGNTEIVSAEKVYKFKAWENCEVNAVNEDHTYTGDKFKIIIDSFTAGSETGIMAEFIGFGSNVVEKGIMWGSNKIAMTKSGTQFSVIADKNGEYKGYAIVGNSTDGYTLITDGLVSISNAE